MKPFACIAASVAVVLFILGCSEKGKEASKTNDKGTMAGLSENAVFLRVNGQSFTKQTL